MSRNDASFQQVTSTGIRIVGRAATDLATTALGLGLQPPETANLLWTSRFKARPRIGGGSAVPVLLQVVTDQIRNEWDACPTLTRESGCARPPGRLHGLSWEVSGEAGAWRGELVWRHRHPVLANVACVTHLLIEEQQAVTSLTLSAAADGGPAGVRGMVGAGQARPRLLDPLRVALALTFDGFDGTPQLLPELEIDRFVREVMLSETRSWPVAVLAPMEGGGFLVPPDELASELFGLAPLYYMDRHHATFRLTDAIGDRRLSAYWGALRVYRPDFSCADRSEDHWLLLRERVDDPLERAVLIGQLGRFAALRHAATLAERRQTERPAPAPAVTNAAAVPAATVGPTAASAPPTPAPTAPIAVEMTGMLGYLQSTMQALTGQLHELARTMTEVAAANAQLADEVARLRTTTAIRASGNRTVERQLAELGALLRPPVETPDAAPAGDDAREEAESRPTLVDVVRHAASEYADGLLLLDSAERTAKESPYEDTDRLAAVLQAMAFVGRRRQEGGLETGLRAAFQELGIDYRAGISKSTSERLRRQYQFSGPDGQVHECLEHIAIGASYDPRYCLRIYFTSRALSDSRFVIGHVGKHLTNMTTT